MPVDTWDKLLLAYLHDPPDKALDIIGHLDRARAYASAVVGEEVQKDDFEKHSDQVASAIERLPMPTAGKDGARAVGVEQASLQVIHPLSGQGHWLTQLDGPDQEEVQQTIREILAELDSPRKKFLALWRLWSNKLAERHPWYARLPADTRTPDHTIWNHLDITAGLEGSLESRGGAFLSFAIGPVQGFIASARTVRDLWSGSMILSYLTFRALRPIVKKLGPTALVYPSLRGIPLLDLWLRDPAQVGDSILIPEVEKRKSPCLPNKFVAVVPWGVDGQEALDLARECKTEVEERWKKIASAVNSQRLSRLVSQQHAVGV
jgi:CRISPR-associated protein Cmr2